MKISLTKRQLLSLCFHVQPRQLNSLEHVRARRATWAAFGATELAADVADLARSERMTVPSEWLDRKAEVSGELSDEAARWLIDVTAPPYQGIDADHIYDVHEKLKEHKAK